MVQLYDLAKNEYLINCNVEVYNSGLSDMTKPMNVYLTSPSLEIVSGSDKRLFQVEALNSRQSKTVQLTLKVNDDNGGYARELQDHKDGLKIQFQLDDGVKGQKEQSLAISGSGQEVVSINPKFGEVKELLFY